MWSCVQSIRRKSTIMKTRARRHPQRRRLQHIPLCSARLTSGLFNEHRLPIIRHIPLPILRRSLLTPSNSRQKHNSHKIHTNPTALAGTPTVIIFVIWCIHWRTRKGCLASACSWSAWTPRPSSSRARRWGRALPPVAPCVETPSYPVQRKKRARASRSPPFSAGAR